MKDHLQMSKERAEKARERSKTSKIASNPSVKFLLSMTRDSLMARIGEWLDAQFISKPQHRLPGYEVIETVPVDVTAYIALVTVMTQYREGSLMGAARAIGRQVIMEARLEILGNVEDSETRDRAKFLADDRNAVRFKQSAVGKVFKSSEVAETWADKMTNKDAVAIGFHLLDLMELDGIITVNKSRTAPPTYSFTHDILRFMESSEALEDTMYPLFRPMEFIRNWTSFDRGPVDDLAWPVPLIKPSSLRIDGMDPDSLVVTPSHAHNQDVAGADLSMAIKAANVMQNTRWRINHVVYNAVVHYWNSRRTVGKLRSAEVVDMPRSLEDEVWQRLSDDERKAIRRERMEKHQKNRQATSDRIQTMWAITQARDVLDTVFHLPVQLDYRGRLYYLPTLNPQGSDPIRAMLEFADAEPIGEQGAAWLAIHLANVGDFDKVSKASFDERLAWVELNEDVIMAVAADPMGTEEIWHAADKPFSFLAACVSYAKVLEEGFTARVHTPVCFDGSNSGIQHYSAALRDPIGGASVNLTPSDLPADIYMDIAEACARYVKGMAEEEPLAQWWDAYGITRGVTKRQVMTYCYASTVYRWKQNILSETLKVDESLQDEDPRELSARAGFMANTINHVLKDELKAAYDGMKWLQTVAKLAAHEAKPVTWTSPAGIPITQIKMETVRSQVRFGQHRRSIMMKPTERVNKTQMANSIGANFIHSLDASHAIRTLAAWIDRDHKPDVQMIHDSFGVPAHLADDMFHLVRETFVDMYTDHDPFWDLYSEMSRRLDADIPTPPMKGDLDISDVLYSPYAFS